MDIHALFEAAEREGRVGVTRKSQEVDARPAVPGEVVVTHIAGRVRRHRASQRSRGTWSSAIAASPPAMKNTW